MYFLWDTVYKFISIIVVIVVIILTILLQVTSIMTQGRGDGKEWVTSFMVSYSTFNVNEWQYVTDQYGNRKVSHTMCSLLRKSRRHNANQKLMISQH